MNFLIFWKNWLILLIQIKLLISLLNSQFQNIAFILIVLLLQSNKAKRLVESNIAPVTGIININVNNININFNEFPIIALFLNKNLIVYLKRSLFKAR